MTAAELLIQHEAELLETLRAFGENTPPVWRLVADEGRFWTPAPLDEDEWERDEPRYCYDNSLELAATYDLRYVEGIAVSARVVGLPVHHAWCVDQTDTVIDVTWPVAGLAYRGIEFPELGFVQDARDNLCSALAWLLHWGSGRP